MRRATAVPAMVNAHSHAFQIALRGVAERPDPEGRDDFWGWRETMYALASSLDPGSMREAGRRAYAEMRAAGYGVVGEFHYLHHQPDGTAHDDPNAMVIALAEAAEEVGIEIVLLPAAYARAGWDPSGRDLPPAGAQRRFVDPDVESFLARVDALRAWAAGRAGVSVGIAAHSCRACPESWLAAIAAHADAHDLVRHVHAAEQPREVEQVRAETGLTPIGLLARAGFLGPRASVVHAIHLEEGDIGLLAESGTTVVACPTTEANLGDGHPPALALAEAGVPIAIGSDSQVRIDPFEEARELEGGARRQGLSRRGLAAKAGGDLWGALARAGRASLGLTGEPPAILLDRGHPQLAGVADADLPAALVSSASAAVALAPPAPAPAGATVVLSRAGDLTPAAVARIACDGTRVELAPALLARLEAARETMLAALGDGPVYGITTGMGYLGGVALSEEEAATHQRRLLLGRAVGGPPWLSREESRALLATRLAGFLSGAAGVSIELCRLLVEWLNDDLAPAVPRRASGSAGEVIPLAHAFQTLVGEGLVLHEAATGGVRSAAEALAERGKEPFVPAAKEGIALLAGAPATLAVAVVRRRAACVLSGQLTLAAACAADVLAAPLDAYDPAVGRLAGDPLLCAVLERLGALLSGAGAREGPQAPVSFRVTPQVLAQLERQLGRLGEDLARALAGTADSPAFVEGRFLTSGNFHAVEVAAGMEALAHSLIRAVELSGQRLHRLLDRRFSGLPDQLTPRPGPGCGLVVVQKRVAGALNELRRLAAPASVGLVDTSSGQEDAMTFGLEAAEALRRVEQIAREVTACELLAARQAWWLRGAPPAPGLAGTAAVLEEAVAPVDEDRPLGPDIERLIRLLERDGLPPG